MQRASLNEPSSRRERATCARPIATRRPGRLTLLTLGLGSACAASHDRAPAAQPRLDAPRTAKVAPRFVDPVSAPATPSLDPAAFLGARACARCHPTHYREWKDSPHALAMRDPVYRALFLRHRQERGAAEDAACTQCHSAIATRTGELQPEFAFERLSSLALEGVTCEACHRVSGLARPYNAGHVFDPSGPLRGPFSDALAPHPAERSALHESAAFCGGCHDVQEPSGLSLESPYREWLDSPARAEGRTCQTCHMPSYPGKAATSARAPERAALHDHSFRTAVPPNPEDGSEARQPTVVGAMSLRLSLATGARGQTLRVTVKNQVDGHHFPTGSAFNRQVWLEVRVHDARGKPLLASGELDPGGDLHDAFAPDAAVRDPYLGLLSAVLRDASGAPTLFTWRAVEVERHGLPPRGERVFPYPLALPDDVAYPVQVAVRLRFRAFAPRLLRALGLAADPAALPILEVARAELALPGPALAARPVRTLCARCAPRDERGESEPSSARALEGRHSDHGNSRQKSTSRSQLGAGTVLARETRQD